VRLPVQLLFAWAVARHLREPDRSDTSAPGADGPDDQVRRG
jgi:hypothetical protein